MNLSMLASAFPSSLIRNGMISEHLSPPATPAAFSGRNRDGQRKASALMYCLKDMGSTKQKAQQIKKKNKESNGFIPN